MGRRKITVRGNGNEIDARGCDEVDVTGNNNKLRRSGGLGWVSKALLGVATQVDWPGVWDYLQSLITFLG